MRSPTLLLVASALAGCGSDDVGGPRVADAGSGVAGCDGATLLEAPTDTAQRGPWPVGARTVSIDGLDAEIWYPATPGSDASATALRYDLRAWLPPAEAAKIPDAEAPRQICECAADLPLDEAHGPYPVVVFVHGTAGFRTQSLELVTHWASRGFVVVAADHPGLYLGDLITSLAFCPGEAPARQLDADLDAIVAAVEAPAGSLAFLSGHVDADHLGMAGHSAGGAAIEARGDDARVLVPMAAGGTKAGSRLASTLVLAAVDDKVVDFAATKQAYADSPAPKRFAALSPAGHLTFSSLCSIVNDAGEDIVAVGKAHQVCGLSLADALFDCDDAYLPAERGWEITNEAASAALEETLHCNPARAGALSGLAARHPEIAEYAATP